MDPIKEYALQLITGLLVGNLTMVGMLWRSVIKRLDVHDKKLEQVQENHHNCQKLLPERFVSRVDFNQQWAQFLHARQADHAMINSRLHSLETQQATLISKIDLFMDDSTKKVERLSATFIAKEGEISKRIDNIADKINHGG